MRIKNSFNNIVYSFLNVIIINIINIFYRTYFIKVLGLEYLGLNTALVNFIAVLSVVELGISQAISYFLYKPISDNNNTELNYWMYFFKETYKKIGFIVVLLSIISLFFITDLIPVKIGYKEFLIIYFLFVANTVITYLFSYKRVLVIAAQQNYKIIPIITIIQVVDIVGRIIILFITQSFIELLIYQMIMKYIECFFVNRMIDKLYVGLFPLYKMEVPRKRKILFKNKIKGILFHKFGDVAINSTDSLIISSIVGVSILGVYSNYLMIITMMTTVILVIFNNLTSSYGSLLVESREKAGIIYSVIQVISFWIFSLSGLMFLFGINDFIIIWLGEKYTLDNNTIILIFINFLLLGMRVPLNTVKTAGGVFENDRYAPVFQGVINLILSVILAKYYGLKGVLFGTFISSLLVPFWVQPYIVYKYIIKENINSYFVKVFTFFVFVFVSCSFIYLSTELIQFKFDPIINLLIKIALVFIVVNVVFTLFYYRTVEFKYFLRELKRKFK